MIRMMMPVDWWRSVMTLAAIAAESQMVIAMRMMGWAGVWNVDHGENLRMVAEKAHAAAEAGRAVSGALLRGGAGAATFAALKPIRRRTRANVRRLRRRGPKAGPRRG